MTWARAQVHFTMKDKEFIFPCLSNACILEDCSGPENKQMKMFCNCAVSNSPATDLCMWAFDNLSEKSHHPFFGLQTSG